MYHNGSTTGWFNVGTDGQYTSVSQPNETFLGVFLSLLFEILFDEVE
jgi:hypothetical protein